MRSLGVAAFEETLSNERLPVAGSITAPSGIAVADLKKPRREIRTPIDCSARE